MLSESSNERDRDLQTLSLVCDGQADATQVRALCAAWRDDPGLEEAWHSWTLAADVLRSDDLASSAAHDRDFLACFRQRLADEPVVLAPLAPPAPQPEAARVMWVANGQAVLRPGRRRWVAPSAVAAGFVVVAGVMVLLGGVPGAGVDNPAMLVQAPAGVLPAGAEQAKRDPQVDSYVNAHRQFTQGAALAAPGGLRQVALTPDGR